MLSFIELRRAAAAIDRRMAGFRVERISQPDAFQLVVTLYGREDGDTKGVKRHLLLSCDPSFGRVGELSAPRASAERPPVFLQFVRPRLDGARLRAARIVGEDRQLALVFDAHEGSFELLLSLLGKRTNCYVLGSDGILLAAQRSLDKTRRNLVIGEPWQNPPEALRREGADRFGESDGDTLLFAIENAYDGREGSRDADDLGTRIAKALRKERKSAEKRSARIDAELAEADQAGDLQKHGELLKGALADVRAGMTEILVNDYTTGEPVRIPLDPKLTPQKNLEATFKRYQKLIRRLTKAGAQSDDAKSVLSRILELEAQLEAALSSDESGVASEVTALSEHEDIARFLRKHAPVKPIEGATPAKKEAKGPFRDVPRKLQPRRYVSADGLEIWVGRSDEGNDHLSTRLARGKDLFFHIDGAPGSHVVLRTEGRPDPPSDSVLDACELAVQFSKLKNAGSADVHVVPIKNVKKPKGAKRGLVYVTGGKNVHLRRDAGRLERLLASRIDD
jgi:predicted ribosome quality control (RQC) complex YloA/Tae2 family protein